MNAASVSTLQASDGGAGVPRHVAIIMDGNGRWAKARHLPRIAGHRRGAEAVRATIRAAGELGIEVLTLYAFSSENWRRPEEEVSDLKGLLRHYLLAELDELANNGVRLKIIGDYRRFGPDLAAMLDNAVARTADNASTTLVIALNYGAQDEIVRAVRALAQDGVAPADIDIPAIAARLDTADLPPLDLLIRTSGERRLSNFLLWQAAYAELLFVDTLWPDFGRDDLFAAVADYGRRDRRFGGL
ncbi:isoprenyl transferase [Sphingomonas sp. KC8]|uniref:isoprenyl transferase n=1 Tax=Sphingomonas sp. KC8 TaxID=1030157 RepID=UPI0002488FF4|nr:isoprenyl transferase [Sphingomonas sp. KC8]ARS27175.1 undecaprenyl pyrophosphate synthase [Sphingomonas sp. KC8]